MVLFPSTIKLLLSLLMIEVILFEKKKSFSKTKKIYGYIKFRMGRINDNVYLLISFDSLGSKWFLAIEPFLTFEIRQTLWN